MSEYDPPSNVDAESVLLGTLMHYPTAYATAAATLDRADFTVGAHQLIWDVIGQRIAEHGPTHAATNPVVLVADIEKMGQGSRIGHGKTVFELSDKAITGGIVDELADIISTAAELRRGLSLATALHTAAVNPTTDPSVITDLIADHLDTERGRSERASTNSSVLDWDDFFATDFTDTAFLPGRLMAEGQQMALVGDGKAGKSLFAQEWAWRAGTGQRFLGDRQHDPVRILYLDAENGRDEIQRRYRSFGAGPANMGELRYASFPQIPPLDTPAGGLAVMAMVRDTKAQLVFIDTVSRFISGAENDSDTWLALYRNTLMPLKRAGIASVRLDHFGKDKEKGSRGSSAKTQDVDHIWELTATGGGLLSLRRTHTRTGIGEDQFGIRRMSQKVGDHYVAGATRHELAAGESGMPLIPGSVQDIVDQLDRAGVSADLGRDRIRGECDRLGIKAANGLLSDVVRIRKHNAPNGTSHLSANLSPTMNTTTVPNARTGQEEIPGQTCPGQVADSTGQAEATPVPSASSLRRGQVGQPRPETVLCTVCSTPLAAELTAKGITVHVLC